MIRRTCRFLTPPALKTVEVGARFREGWALSYAASSPSGVSVSPWHDIQGIVDVQKRLVNAVIEIPKGTRPKLEINTKKPYNPIVQDVKNGELRSFTYGDIPFHYGAVPQTYEDPSKVDPSTGFRGDSDPLDVVLLGITSPVEVGAVMTVKVRGVLAMIDEGETDWKLICTPASHQGEDVTVADIDAVRHWFRFYKTTDGKPENQFAFDGVLKDENFAWGVVEECHHAYLALVQGRLPNPKSLWLPSSSRS
jgi:inorganic pyrophosphatase